MAEAMYNNAVPHRLHKTTIAATSAYLSLSFSFSLSLSFSLTLHVSSFFNSSNDSSWSYSESIFFPGRRNVGCPLLQVCVHLDRLNAENTFHSSLYSV